MRVYTKHGVLTKAGKALDKKISNRLKGVIKECLDAGASSAETKTLVSDILWLHITFENAKRRVNLKHIGVYNDS